MKILDPRRYRWLAGAVVMLVALFIPIQVLFGRGGGNLRWGYRPPAGNPLNMWVYASPWAALSGWGIPHHSIEGGRFGGRGSPGSSINYGSGGGAQFPAVDRSVMFPGSSSNLSTALPSFNTRVPSGPYRTERRFDPPYFRNYHSYWRNGYWGGGKWGWGRWAGILGIGGFGRWSFGPVYYASGYGIYSNPFVAGQKPPLQPFLDYSKPLEDIPDDDEPLTGSTDPAANEKQGAPLRDEETPEEIQNYLVRTPEVRAGLKSFDAARDAFKTKNYDLALEKCNAAIEQLPFDSELHEFRALVLFAREDYQQSAAAIHAVLAVAPGWDWTTLSSLYSDQEEFPRQLRGLEAAHKQNPDSAVLAFLRGYHYTTCRHFEAAVKQFQSAARLLPGDELIPALARLISGAVETTAPAAEPGTTNVSLSTATHEPPEQEPRPIAKALLIGEWKAFRAGKVSIELKLRDDQQFVWVATQDEDTYRMAGRYVVEGNFLFLGGGSGTLVGRVQMRKQGGFNFTLLDNNPTDSGLDFASGPAR